MTARSKSKPKVVDPASIRREDRYNPLEKLNLARSVAEALLEKPLEALPPPERFLGAGVYAIYYFGDHPLYQSLAAHNRSSPKLIPVYVGKAVPEGARKGAELNIVSGAAIYKRLSEHADTVRSAANLRIEDFKCRYLAVDDIFIQLGESLLIAKHLPVWNLVIDGFGNHHPGAGRLGQKRSSWDMLHPGRGWSAKLAESAHTVEILTARVESHFQANRKL